MDGQPVHAIDHVEALATPMVAKMKWNGEHAEGVAVLEKSPPRSFRTTPRPKS